jgi:hypothetical protein
MKNQIKGSTKISVPPGGEKIFNEKNRLVNAWIMADAKPGRIFSMNCHCAVVTTNGQVPYDEITTKFLYLAQAILGKINPRFYFDIVTDKPSGIKIIKLQTDRTYCCKVSPGLSNDLPEDGILPADESSFLISLITYLNCYHLTKDVDKKLADEFAKRYVTLRQSETNKTEDGKIPAINFGDLE